MSHLTFEHQHGDRQEWNGQAAGACASLAETGPARWLAVSGLGRLKQPAGMRSVSRRRDVTIYRRRPARAEGTEKGRKSPTHPKMARSPGGKASCHNYVSVALQRQGSFPVASVAEAYADGVTACVSASSKATGAEIGGVVPDVAGMEDRDRASDTSTHGPCTRAGRSATARCTIQPENRQGDAGVCWPSGKLALLMLRSGIKSW